MTQRHPLVSVVIATYNRPLALRQLLKDLSNQSMQAEEFEVIVVDDGSKSAIEPIAQPEKYPFHLKIIRQENQGPAAARNRGVGESNAELIVFIDDDMRLHHNFLMEHYKQHQATHCVHIGRITTPEGSTDLPVFEQFHLRHLQAQQKRIGQQQKASGSHLCTGNVSMRREDFLAVGGFDVTLPRSEDRDLGLRLEKHGIQIRHTQEAISTHHTDHADAGVWLQRSHDYGRADVKIGRKHPDIAHASPWRFLFLINPVARPLVGLSALFPEQLGALPGVLLAMAQHVHTTAPSTSARLTELSYAVQYFRGVGQESESLDRIVEDVTRYLAHHQAPEISSPLHTFISSVLQDHFSIVHYREKYHQDSLSVSGLPAHLLSKTGFQILTLVRLMQACQTSNRELLAATVSRLMRHFYGVDIHPDANIAPGISIIHGNGLVISRHATIEKGCILFHNVTLGEGIEPSTKKRGGPHLQSSVHVGPGSTILGPVVVGAHTKIQAGCVVTESLPQGSRAMAPTIRLRTMPTYRPRESQSHPDPIKGNAT